ncbi:hypothetical protein XM72_c20329 [Vibrio vulnificus]|nr:hypothetical protein XM72_c20329 [Vibrio vulnificus]
MFRVKKLLGGTLSLRNYNTQVGETYAMVKALNKLTGLGVPENQNIVYKSLNFRQFGFSSELRSQAMHNYRHF